MFFTGTLQEGISKALQESKLVICFVTDNGEESKTWEDEYLTDDTIAPSLDSDAVLLRLEAGSQEAGYLAAIFPLPRNPTLVIIKNGELKEYISAGTPREQLVERVIGAFQAQAQAQAGGATAQEGDDATSAVTASTGTSSSPNPRTPGQDTPAPPSSNTLTREGEARRQEARRERDEAEKRRREKGKMRSEGEQDPEKARQDDTKRKAAQQLAERQRQAREERARVLKRIEDDKAERRARDEARRAERRMGVAAAAAAADVDVDHVTAAAGEPAPASSSAIRRQHDQCAIQVRLFDGSTIRSRFPAGATLATDVRGWIDEARVDGNSPYTFRVILTPLPNRIIDPATEEDRTLGELELTPSSTLVLAPSDRYSPAYPRINAGPNSPVSRLIAAVLAFVGNILGAIAGTLTGSRSRGETSNEGGDQESIELQERPQQGQQGHATGRDGGGSSRIKGFEDRDDRQKEYQLYNGNSLNFEPRKDEDEKDK